MMWLFINRGAPYWLHFAQHKFRSIFYVNKPTQDLNNRSPALCLAVSHTPQNIKRPLQLLLHYRQSGEIIKPALLSGSSEQTISFWLCLRVHFRLLHNQQRSHKYFRTAPAQHVPSWSTVHYCATIDDVPCVRIRILKMIFYPKILSLTTLNP